HRLTESAGHDSSRGRPGAGAESNWMNFNRRVGCVVEHRLEILDVLLDSLGLMTVGPRDNDVFRMALGKPVPALIGKDIEIEHVEDLEVSLNVGRLLLRWRRGIRWVLDRGLGESRCGEHGCYEHRRVRSLKSSASHDSSPWASGRKSNTPASATAPAKTIQAL